VHSVDEIILDDPSNEETCALDYYLNSCAHLLNVLHADPKLCRSGLAGLLKQKVFAVLETDPSERDERRAEEAAKWLALFGVVGKALWFLRNKNDVQLRRELTRLATDPQQVVGNQYLFYIAGTLAAKGYGVQFVTEQAGSALKTPDLCASKLGKSTWIEANTKSPITPVDTAERLAWMVRDIVAEKK